MSGYSLLVWEEVPENTKFYLIPNTEADKYRRYLEEAHNKFINCDEMNDGMKFLNTALGEEVAEEGFEEHLARFVPYLYNNKYPITDTTITAVYLSGFVL